MDGDGQSRYNLVSPDQMVEFLKWMKEQFLFFPEFLASFPISGVDGTLRERMSDPSLKGKVRAKTGTMTGISSLAGYAMTTSGELLAFSLFINGFTKPASTYKLSLEDAITLLMTKFSFSSQSEEKE
jgi:D-alanyl-D-alanine carboxypeptidase/D-alanyl-D-alanine-endopeptidase (penicillin-binding protein 4)